MWQAMLPLLMLGTLAPQTPMVWEEVGSSQTAKTIRTLVDHIEQGKALKPEQLANLKGDDRAYFQGLLLANNSELKKLRAHLSKVSDSYLRRDLKTRWFQLFADSNHTVTKAMWRELGATLESTPEELTSLWNPTLRRFAIERPSDARSLFETLLKRVPDGSSQEAQLTYYTIVALLEMKPVSEDRLRRHRTVLYTKHPLHSLTPRKPPRGVSFPNDAWLTRIEALVEGHLNERALDELNRFRKGQRLTKNEACRANFIEGLAYRKLRNYRKAEQGLEAAAQKCVDQDYKRRAHYLWAKVVSIRDGLAAIKPIESFAKRFPGHSMVDDVLFWAGDVYQRRDRWEEADRYYERTQASTNRGDHCAEARWRRAWMSVVNQDWEMALTKLKLASQEDCEVKAQDFARALYWLGMVHEELGDRNSALASWNRLVKQSPLSFYSQLVLGRVGELAPSKRLAWSKSLPASDEAMSFCLGSLASSSSWSSAYHWAERGYNHFARSALKKIEWDRVVLGKAPGCTIKDPHIVLAFGYRQLGDQDRGYRILRGLWSDKDAQSELVANRYVLKLLYPDLFSDILSTNETKYALPSYFLQALAREESSFHPNIASWAGARGLLQLMPGTAKRIAKRAKIRYRGEGDLLNPTINASLGGALMRELSRKFKGDPAAMLAGYNASQKASSTWRSKHLDHEIDRMIESITVKETRKYVKRVLETWGIYRWLYGKNSIALKPWRVGEPLKWAGGR